MVLHSLRPTSQSYALRQCRMTVGLMVSICRRSRDDMTGYWKARVSHNISAKDKTRSASNVKMPIDLHTLAGSRCKIEVGSD
jgi:hypothetical protein